MTPSTTQSYRRSWSLFNEFTVNYKISHTDTQMPFSSQLIAVFVAYLFNNGFQASSIRSHLSAISYSHRIQGMPSPCDSFLINKLLKGAAVLLPGGDMRLPITMDILRELLHVIPVLSVGHYKGPLYCAMCATAFFAFLRCSEYCASPHCLLFHQLYMCPSGDYATIDFRSFKHSTAQKRVIIRLESKSDLSICPIYHLKHYLQLRGTRPGPIFCDINGAPISRNAFISQLRTCLNVLTLDCQQYKAHSFRIGAATHALYTIEGRSEADTNSGPLVLCSSCAQISQGCWHYFSLVTFGQ